MAERRPLKPFAAAPAGARRVRVGRLFPAARVAAANDNHLAWGVRLRRASYWLALAAAAGWLVWSNF